MDMERKTSDINVIVARLNRVAKRGFELETLICLDELTQAARNTASELREVASKRPVDFGW